MNYLLLTCFPCLPAFLLKDFLGNSCSCKIPFFTEKGLSEIETCNKLQVIAS